MSGTQAAQPMNAQAQNAAVRSLILRGGMVGKVYYPPAVDMWQQLSPIFPAAVGPGAVLTVQLRNVGLVKRLVLEINATITAGAQALALTKLGLANLISNITFIDLGNNTRLNCAGWALQLVSTVKRRRVFGAAVATDTPTGYGINNTQTMSAPTSIASGTAADVHLIVEIPFVKSNVDLRGAIFADVTNAVMQCQITLNPNMFVASGTDATLAVYQSGGAALGTLSNFRMQVNQNYLDQLPRNPQTAAPYLPALDLGTAYLINTTSGGLPVVNQDNGYAFVNNRSYESVGFIFDNNGTLNANGSDLNYVALTSANFTNLLRYDGQMLCALERDIVGSDLPVGMHYLDFRHRPISTDQYGNMQLILNPSNVGGSGATFLFMWEAFGIIGLVNQGGSLPMAS